MYVGSLEQRPGMQLSAWGFHDHMGGKGESILSRKLPFQFHLWNGYPFVPLRETGQHRQLVRRWESSRWNRPVFSLLPQMFHVLGLPVLYLGGKGLEYPGGSR